MVSVAALSRGSGIRVQSNTEIVVVAGWVGTCTWCVCECVYKCNTGVWAGYIHMQAILSTFPQPSFELLLMFALCVHITESCDSNKPPLCSLSCLHICYNTAIVGNTFCIYS